MMEARVGDRRNPESVSAGASSAWAPAFDTSSPVKHDPLSPHVAEAAQRADVRDCRGGGGVRAEPGREAGAAAVHGHPAGAVQGAGQRNPPGAEAGLPSPGAPFGAAWDPRQGRHREWREPRPWPRHSFSP